MPIKVSILIILVCF